MASRKILCVDDEPTVLSVTMNVLRDIFPQETVVGVNAPEDAAAVLAEGDIAVLITDLSMPNIDGAEVIRQAHDANPDTISILVTGRASTEGLIRALNEGHLWKCLEKPWRPEQIEELVSGALEIWASRSKRADEAAAEAEQQPEQSKGKQPKKIILGGKSKARKLSRAPKPRFRLKQGAGKAVRPGGKKLRIMDKRYRDMELIKEGGSGAIYKAYDTLLDIPVAIKIISEKLANNQTAMKELVAEARIAMGLSHKHIVRLHNIQQGNGFYYLVMEYIKGDSLRDVLEQMQQELPPDMCLQIMAVMEDALGYAHRRGVFHRDMKPDNIMLGDDGILKIIDFGLACLGRTFRRNGQIEGTPYYMSPEEMACEVPDQRTDVFSVGVMMHEFLQGSLPPHGAETDLVDPMDYVPVASPLLPESVQEVLQMSFARDRAERWPDMHEFAAAFRRAIAQGYSVV